MSLFVALTQSTLRLHVKQIIQGASGLQLPPMPGVPPQSEDASSWWDFVSVDEVLPPDEAHPDLVAKLKDGSQLFIEIAINSFVDEEKLERLQAVGVKTIEIDLSEIRLSHLTILSEELKNLVLHRTDIKTWIYPDYMFKTPY